MTKLKFANIIILIVYYVGFGYLTNYYYNLISKTKQLLIKTIQNDEQDLINLLSEGENKIMKSIFESGQNINEVTIDYERYNLIQKANYDMMQNVITKHINSNLRDYYNYTIYFSISVFMLFIPFILWIIFMIFCKIYKK
jgi:hypothetical protein